MPVWRDWRIIGVFAVLTVLSACTVVPQTPSTDQAGNALLHRERLLHANPEEAARLLNEARARVATQPSLTNRVELALLLLLPGSHAGQRLEAQTLLKGCDTPLPDDSSTALCGFTLALLGDAIAAEQKVRTLEEEAKDAERRAVELQRQLGALYAQSAAKLESEAQKRLRGLERQLTDQRAQIDGLRQQLQELQAIERSIGTRHEAPLDVGRAP